MPEILTRTVGDATSVPPAEVPAAEEAGTSRSLVRREVMAAALPPRP